MSVITGHSKRGERSHQADGQIQWKHLFLLSHMRANTSLMGHLLGSHPEICGYYEMHRSYRSAQDLVEQARNYFAAEAHKPLARFLFDKLLHDDYSLMLEAFLPEQITVLLSLRSAEQTIRSIVHLFRGKTNGHPYADPEQATVYYLNRLETLRGFCERYPERYCYYDADLIRQQPEALLLALQQWLALSSPLNQTYQLFSRTGQAGVGDSSVNLQAGNIVQQVADYSAIVVPEACLEQARQAYARQRMRIVQLARESLTV